MMRSYVPKKPDGSDMDGKEDDEPTTSKEKLPMANICSSTALDSFLESSKADLKVSYPIPRCEGAEFISEKSTRSDLPIEFQVLHLISMA